MATFKRPDGRNGICHYATAQNVTPRDGYDEILVAVWDLHELPK